MNVNNYRSEQRKHERNIATSSTQGQRLHSIKMRDRAAQCVKLLNKGASEKAALDFWNTGREA